MRGGIDLTEICGIQETGLDPVTCFFIKKMCHNNFINFHVLEKVLNKIFRCILGWHIVTPYYFIISYYIFDSVT